MIEVTCNLCGAQEYSVLFPASLGAGEISVDAFACTNPGYGDHLQIVKCVRCGHVYANPRWSEAELIDAYRAVEDEVYVTERHGRELTFRKHLQALEKRIGRADGRSLLDVGAYIGVFVATAQAAGWDAIGVEPSAWAADYAQEQGLQVLHGTQDAPALHGCAFDVVTMWDVIEHVADPSAEMAKAYQLLKPGGWLVVHTMDIDSLTARLMGRRWPWFMDMHIHYFSQKTMRRMLTQNGFAVAWSGIQGRYLRLNYLVSRVTAINSTLGKVSSAVVNGLRLGRLPVPVNFGDLFTVYAQRPPSVP